MISEEDASKAGGYDWIKFADLSEWLMGIALPIGLAANLYRNPSVECRGEQRIGGAERAYWGEKGGTSAAFHADQVFSALEADRRHHFLHRQPKSPILNAGCLPPGANG